MTKRTKKYILWFSQISKKDVPLVGGKNASLGEMFSELTGKGINVPPGFATTSFAFWRFLEKNNISPKLKDLFRNLDSKNLKNLQKVGKEARTLILKAGFPEDFKKEIIEAYRKLEAKYGKTTNVAIRSSATAEDLPSASFAGMHETYLNIKGEKELLKAVKKCLASLFNDRAISYREEKGFSHFKIALSVGVQKMVRNDTGSSGVIFTLDTETGFPNVVLINSIYGAGEMIVKGKITPDQFYVFKPTIRRFALQDKSYNPIIIKNLGRKNRKYVYKKEGGLREVKVSQKNQLKFSLKDEEILTLAKWAVLIEEHYGAPQDIEWAKDGETGQLFIVQARPETVHSFGLRNIYEEYEMKTNKKPILKGIAVGNKIGQGKVRIISDVSKISQFQKGEVLTTRMTDPDWVPAMRVASAIVTDEGARTCHAAIIGRELGVPVIVGTGRATKILKTGERVTVDCTEEEGKIFDGKIPFRFKKYNLKKIPKLPVKIAVNIGAPEIAFKSSFLPVQGVGLARQEFIIAEKIRIHPLALYHYKKLKDRILKKKIEKLTIEHKDKREYFIKELAEGIAQIAAAFWPREVILRLSDLKTNEYRALLGGELFEPEEQNPMLGFRGAARYYDKKFQPAFEMECRAIKRAREVFGLKNIQLMVPFCRTPEEGKKVLDLLAKNGLEKGKNGLKIIVMAEIPSNVILAKEFLDIFDGMSIGSNDLTQLVLGLDRDNGKISYIGNEQNEAVKHVIKKVIEICKKRKKYIGICGDAPSTIPGFAEFLIQSGIETISLSPDAVMKTIINLSKIKK